MPQLIFPASWRQRWRTLLSDFILLPPSLRRDIAAAASVYAALDVAAPLKETMSVWRCCWRDGMRGGQDTMASDDKVIDERWPRHSRVRASIYQRAPCQSRASISAYFTRHAEGRRAYGMAIGGFHDVTAAFELAASARTHAPRRARSICEQGHGEGGSMTAGTRARWLPPPSAAAAPKRGRDF